jgi:hypothetical protein
MAGKKNPRRLAPTGVWVRYEKTCPLRRVVAYDTYYDQYVETQGGAGVQGG